MVNKTIALSEQLGITLAEAAKMAEPCHRVMPCEVWSRAVGYYRPVDQWNPGKQEEFYERKNITFKSDKGGCK
jgi:anaerobic ribonucleoside-triphosphate reductase